MDTRTLTLRCRCCEPAGALLPRVDLEPGVAVCPRSGRLHRAGALAYELISEGPPLARRAEAPAARPIVRIDLSKEGYA
ncbi:MAG: hypothetical protein HGA45_04025 [Chloroflexales bacterium]|nr:hypothetical protein [Chloroflexales bacterium]